MRSDQRVVQENQSAKKVSRGSVAESMQDRFAELHLHFPQIAERKDFWISKHDPEYIPVVLSEFG